jgi:hypothetical protein
MNGHQSIIEARIYGRTIPHIWVHAFTCNRPAELSYMLDPENLLELGLRPEVHVYANDNLARLDMRFVMGTTVHLSGEDSERLYRLINHLAKYKPLRVLAVVEGSLVDEVREAA